MEPRLRLFCIVLRIMEARLSQRGLTQQSLMMPHRESGEVDWQTLGNILSANLIEEVLYGSYLDVKHRISRPSFTVDTDWKFSYEENDVVVLRKYNSESPIHCWMGRAVVNFPLKDVAAFIANPASPPLIDKYIVERRPVELISKTETQTDAVVYYRTEAKHCLMRTIREFLFYVRYAHFDGKYIQTALSVEHPLCPPVPAVVRAQILPGSGWHLEPYMGNSERTLVSYLAHIDLVGIPPIIANRVLKRQPMNIVYVKKYLTMQQTQTHFPPSLMEENSHSNDPHMRFEDPLSVTDFTTYPAERMRAISDPSQN